MNPEDKVIHDIDALVDAQLQRGPYGRYSWGTYNFTGREYEDCPHCPHDWHGLACEVHLCRCTSSTGDVINVVNRGGGGGGWHFMDYLIDEDAAETPVAIRAYTWLPGDDGSGFTREEVAAIYGVPGVDIGRSP